MLLASFQSSDISIELRATTALAIAYILPAYVVSESQAKLAIGINIVKCLRFMSSCQGFGLGSISTDTKECFQAFVVGLLTLWNCLCEPMFLANKVNERRLVTETACQRSACRAETGGCVLDQPKELVELSCTSCCLR